jgi:hypothetical protein
MTASAVMGKGRKYFDPYGCMEWVQALRRSIVTDNG